jgi:hypothetical protein
MLWKRNIYSENLKKCLVAFNLLMLLKLSYENYLLSCFLPQTPEGALGLQLFEMLVDARSPL